jgi:hypothetical protein
MRLDWTRTSILSDPTFSDSRKISDPTISDSRIRRDADNRNPMVSDSRKTSEMNRISPVSDYRNPVGSDRRIKSDFLGSDGIRRGSFDLGIFNQQQSQAR